MGAVPGVCRASLVLGDQVAESKLQAAAPLMDFFFGRAYGSSRKVGHSHAAYTRHLGRRGSFLSSPAHDVGKFPDQTCRKPVSVVAAQTYKVICEALLREGGLGLAGFGVSCMV